MTYGLRILSANGRTVIDTNDSFVGEKIRGTSAIAVNSSGTAWPPTGLQSEELPLVSTKSGTSGSVGLSYSEYGLSAPTIFSPSNGFQWWPLGKQESTTGGYGLRVLNADGSIAFNATDIGVGLEIVAAGTMTAKIGTFTMEAGRDPMRYVVDISNTYKSTSTQYTFAGDGTVVGSSTNIVEKSYYFDRVNNKIILQNWAYNDGDPSNTTQTGAPFIYMIAYLLY